MTRLTVLQLSACVPLKAVPHPSQWLWRFRGKNCNVRIRNPKITKQEILYLNFSTAYFQTDTCAFDPQDYAPVGTFEVLD